MLAGLDHRERGGYERVSLTLHLRESERGPARRARGLVYVAGPDNPNYLGHAPVAAIAAQVARARGPSGANPEYVFELARSLRSMGAVDDHVFAVERALEAALGRGGQEASR